MRVLDNFYALSLLATTQFAACVPEGPILGYPANCAGQFFCGYSCTAPTELGCPEEGYVRVDPGDEYAGCPEDDPLTGGCAIASLIEHAFPGISDCVAPARCTAGAAGAGASGDPHLHLAHGGKADVRGEDGGIYSMLSAKDLNMNVEMASADFRWSKRLIHGTKMRAAYWTLRTNASSSLLTVEFSDSTAAMGPKSHAIAHIGGKNFTIDAGHPFRMGNVAVSVIGSGVTVSTDNHWEMSATLAPFPFAGLNPRQKLINVKVKALYDADNDVVAPHGLFGQSYDGDEVAVDGAVDARNQEEATTTAQAEGAIEGVIADYKMADKFATEFKYSRFDATSAPHRDVTKLTGWKHAAKKPISVGATDVDDAEASPVQSTD